jgi:hypothetical protein
MRPLSFARDIKPLFSKYILDMNRVKLGTESGTQSLLLGNYASVKQFYYEIQVSIHGYDFAPDGTQLVPTNKLMRTKDGSDYVRSAPHPMPPIQPLPPNLSLADPRLPQQAIDTFDQWVKDGMPA